MQVLKEGQRVRLTKPMGWWLKDDILYYFLPIDDLPVGTLGTLRKFKFSPYVTNTMYEVVFDDYPHPKEDGHCGLMGNDGDPLPYYLEYVQEETCK